MKKHLKNLAVWWGWMYHKHEAILSAITPIIIICLFCVAFATAFNMYFLFAVVTFICAIILSTLVIFGLYHAYASRNWRVAVDVAEKMKKDSRYGDRIDLLDGMIDLAKARKRGHDLTEIIEFLRERETLRDQIRSLLEEQQNIYRKRAHLEEKLVELKMIIDNL